ncbi:glycosyltransferase [Streptomyces mashuensis]|nr:glycosyltransferase [Streptomyces mashuensis]
MTAGSRGDVAPYTGVGHALVGAGHDVTLVTHERFAPLVAGSGVRFHAMPVDPRDVLESEWGRGLHRSTTGPGKFVRAAVMARRLVGQMADSLLEAARASDVVLPAGSMSPMGHTIAEGLSLPSMGLNLQPVHPTRDFAPPMTGGGSLGPAGNRWAGHALLRAMEHIFTPAVRDLRKRLGLPPMTAGAAQRARERRDWPVQHGFSPLVVPRPRDWRPGLEVAGYWWPYDPEPALPQPLLDFLAAGPPPVFVGLGSATVPDPARLSGEVVRALRAAGLRGVLQEGWAGLRATGDDMITVGDVPHSVLFPRMAAVVHHAGAGTTGAGLRAGVPAVPVPVQFDAGFWAARLVALGVAPRAVPLRRLTAPALTGALVRATTDPQYRRRARDLAARIAAEDGTGHVAAALGRLPG